MADLSRLAEAASNTSWLRAAREERTDVEQRLAGAKSELETAKRHKDAPATVSASRRVEQYEGRLSSIADSSKGRPKTVPPQGAWERSVQPRATGWAAYPIDRRFRGL